MSAVVRGRPGVAPRPVWKAASPPGEGSVRRLAGELNLSLPLCRLLVVRGHAAPSAARSFLRPALEELHDPGLLKGAERAATRIARAVERRELVVVHGDYDVDGIAANALLTRWIRDLGGRAEAIVPDRLRHGYDLSAAGVARAARLGADLLITVDCGIVAHEAVRMANEAGMTVVVTDHHQPGPTLPDAFAVVNPMQPGCSYPNRHLCGAGVAWRIGQRLARLRGRPPEEAWRYLDLVAIATIADQVPLVGENRVLAHYGLRVAQHTAHAGLRALMRIAGLEDGERPGSRAVSFRIGPRINAAGRVGEADDALRLLLTDDEEEAARLAQELEETNRRRREIEAEVAEDAFAVVAREWRPEEEPVAVVAGEGWHPGVIGIVASRLVERVGRPVIVVGLDPEKKAGRGSARSVPALDIHAAIAECRRHLVRFGGHHQAAGLDIHPDRLPEFRSALARAARRLLDGADPRPELRIDMEISLEEAEARFHRLLQYIGPFGRGNPEPVFVARRVSPRSTRTVGERHLRMAISQGETLLQGIAFGLAGSLSPETLGGRSGPDPGADRWRNADLPPLDVAFHLVENRFRGTTTIEARVLDLRPAG